MDKNLDSVSKDITYIKILTREDVICIKVSVGTLFKISGNKVRVTIER